MHTMSKSVLLFIRLFLITGLAATFFIVLKPDSSNLVKPVLIADIILFGTCFLLVGLKAKPAPEPKPLTQQQPPAQEKPKDNELKFMKKDQNVVRPATTGTKQLDDDSAAILLLSLLQEKGRFIDFLMEDVMHYSNEQIGIAARIVHQGCHQVIVDIFNPKPIANENEIVKLEKNYSTRAYKLSKSTDQTPPFSAKIIHKGWMAQQVKLPTIIDKNKDQERFILYPAEIDLL